MILLCLNNGTSIALILMCWWLTHSYAQAGYRWAAGLLAFVGINTLLTMINRNIEVIPASLVPWQIVATKAFLSAFLLAVACRRRRQDKLLGQLHGQIEIPARNNHRSGSEDEMVLQTCRHALAGMQSQRNILRDHLLAGRISQAVRAARSAKDDPRRN